MNQKTKDRILNGSIIACASAPFWLTAVFSITNIHDEVMVDGEGNILHGLITRDEYRDLKAISFDKTGTIFKSLNFGHFNSYRFLDGNKTHIYLNIALPKSGVLGTVEKIKPTQEELSYAESQHNLACQAVRVNKLKGYNKLNCKTPSLEMGAL